MIEKFLENITLNALIVALILNVIYDFIKGIFFWLIKVTSSIANTKSYNNILFLIKYYKRENANIKKIENKDGDFLKKVSKELINDSIFGFIILVILLILNNVENRLLFFGTLGSSLIILLKVFASFFYYIKLFYKSKFPDKYIFKNLKRIAELEKILLADEKKT